MKKIGLRPKRFINIVFILVILSALLFVTNTARGASVATSITVTGASSISIPVSGSKTSTYTATVNDQYGEVMIGQTSTWSLASAVTGVKINKSTGVLTISTTAVPGKVSVKAKSGSISKTYKVTLVKAISTSISITGASSIIIPAGGSTVSAYKAIVKDQYDQTIIGKKAAWSLTTAVTGAAIDSSTGVLTISSKAVPGNVSIKAKSGAVSVTCTVTLVRGASVATSITVTGASSVIIPPSESNLSTYAATVNDQYKQAMADQTVTWSLASAVTGVSIDSSTGILTVSSTAAPGPVSVKATNGSLTKIYTVTLARAASVATSITVTGASSIIIPASGSKTSTYKATVKDQYGLTMTDAIPTWSLASYVTGASVSSTGVLTVSRMAVNSTVTVKATVGSLSKTHTVTLAVSYRVSSLSKFVSAYASAQPGDQIVIANGTYKDFQVSLEKSGTAGHLITIKAATPGGVIFTGDTRFYIKGSYMQLQNFDFNHVINADHQSVILLNDASNCRITGNKFNSCRTGNEWIAIINLENSSQNNRLDHNSFKNPYWGCGIRIVSDYKLDNNNINNIIDHNYFSAVDKNDGWKLAAIQLGQQMDPVNDPLIELNTVVEYNLFENVAPSYAEVVCIKTSRNIIRCNTLRNCSGSISLRAGNNNLVEGNFCINSCGVGISQQNGSIVKNNYMVDCSWSIHLAVGNFSDTVKYDGSDHKYKQTENVTVIHNTIIHSINVAPIYLGMHYDASNGMILEPKHCLIANNFIITNNKQVIRNMVSSDIAYKNNYVYVEGTANLDFTDPGILISYTNPEVSLVKGIYRPGTKSPLINYCDPIDGFAVTDDMDGQSRIEKPDCGADEVSDAAIARRPLNASDVGATR